MTEALFKKPVFVERNPLFKWQGVHINFKLEGTVLSAQEALDINLDCQEELENLGLRLRYEIDKLTELGTAEAQGTADRFEKALTPLHQALDLLTEVEEQIQGLAMFEEQSSQWAEEEEAKEAEFAAYKRERLLMAKLPEPQPQRKPRKVPQDS